LSFVIVLGIRQLFRRVAILIERTVVDTGKNQ